MHDLPTQAPHEPALDFTSQHQRASPRVPCRAWLDFESEREAFGEAYSSAASRIDRDWADPFRDARAAPTQIEARAGAEPDTLTKDQTHGRLPLPIRTLAHLVGVSSESQSSFCDHLPWLMAQRYGVDADEGIGNGANRLWALVSTHRQVGQLHPLGGHRPRVGSPIRLGRHHHRDGRSGSRTPYRSRRAEAVRSAGWATTRS